MGVQFLVINLQQMLYSNCCKLFSLVAPTKLPREEPGPAPRRLHEGARVLKAVGTNNLIPFSSAKSGASSDHRDKGMLWLRIGFFIGDRNDRIASSPKRARPRVNRCGDSAITQ